MNIEIIFAEFGKVNVDVEHFRHYFPDAKFTLFTDVPYQGNDFDSVKTPYPVLDKNHPRYPWRMNDLWQIKGMLFSSADICIAFDSDVYIQNDLVKTIIPLAEKFGLCLPANPRMLVDIDASIGTDGGSVDDESGGMGFAYNCAITALDMRNKKAKECAIRFCEIMKMDPVRGPLAWWRAVWQTGFNPYLLPFQWCVCADHVGIGNEIILHTGHERVKKYYNL